MRAIWSGAIGFGLVNIPVKLYSATQSSDLDLDMLDKSDHSNIRYKRVNERTGKEVPWKNIVKGYDLDGRYVVLSDEDFEKAAAEKTKLIEINAFVDEQEIESIYYDTPYFLEAGKNGSRAYALLRDALQKTGKAGLGIYVLRDKEHLCLIKPYGNLLILNKIRFAQEIRDAGEVTAPKSSAKAGELKMAVTLINQLTEKFDISKYKNTYSSQLLRFIKAKAKGRKAPAAKMKVVHSKTKDLMAQLKASIEGPKRKAS